MALAELEYIGGGGGNMPFTHYAEGTFQLNGSTAVDIETGFEPKIIIIYFESDTPLVSSPASYWVNPASHVATYVNSSWSMASMGSRYTVKSVSSTGFSYIGYSGITSYRKYVAIG